MNKSFKIITAFLSAGLIVTPISGIFSQNQNIAKAIEVHNDVDIINNNDIKPTYDGWAGDNKTTTSYYISYSDLKNKPTDQLNRILVSGIGYLLPGGLLSAFISYIIGGAFTNNDFYTARATALNLNKGLLVRLRFQYKKDYYGNYIPSSVNYYYSPM